MKNIKNKIYNTSLAASATALIVAASSCISSNNANKQPVDKTTKTERLQKLEMTPYNKDTHFFRDAADIYIATLKKKNVKLFNDAAQKYRDRIYADYKLKKYYTPSDIARLNKAVQSYHADTTKTYLTAESTLGDLNQYRHAFTMNRYFEQLGEIKTPFEVTYDTEELMFYDYNLCDTFFELQYQESLMDAQNYSYQLQDNTDEGFERRLGPLVHKLFLLEQRMAANAFANEQQRTAAQNNIDNLNIQIRQLTNAMYVIDPETGMQHAKSVVEYFAKNRINGIIYSPDGIQGFEINFNIPEFNAIQTEYSANYNEIKKIQESKRQLDKLRTQNETAVLQNHNKQK